METGKHYESGLSFPPESRCKTVTSVPLLPILFLFISWHDWLLPIHKFQLKYHLFREIFLLEIILHPSHFLLYHPLFPSEHLFQYVTTLRMYFYVLFYCTTASIEILSCLLLYSQHPVQAQTHSLCSSNIFLMNK